MSLLVKQAKELILAADLSPVEHEILIDDFIDQAYDPELAAQEVINRVQSGHNTSPYNVLQRLKRELRALLEIAASPMTVGSPARELVMRRDHGRCCVKPEDCKQVCAPEPTYILSPSLRNLWQKGDDDPLLSLLDAFLAPERVARLRKLISDKTGAVALPNLLSVSPSIGRAFRNGHAQLRPVPGLDWNEITETDLASKTSEAKYFIIPIVSEAFPDILLADGTSLVDNRRARRFTLHTDDPDQLPLPSRFLLKTQFKMGCALRRFYVEHEISQGWPPLESPAFWSRRSQSFLRNFRNFVPHYLRALCYRYMLHYRSEPEDIAPAVYRLPCGLYAKRCDRSGDNEPDALKLAEKRAPSVPAPLLIDQFQETDGTPWFVMTSLSGLRVEDVLYRMSYAERHQLAVDLCIAIRQLHKIPNTTSYLFANASGGRIYDRRAASGGCGPYNTEADWNAQISKGWQRNLMEAIPSAFSKSHKSVFTHSDLFFSNVLVDGGRLSGIVDWECAGFLPEYWEFTKAMRAAVGDKDARAVYWRIWGDRYEEELKVETWLWQVFPFGGPVEGEDTFE